MIGDGVKISTKKHQLVLIDIKSTSLDVIIFHATGRESRRDNGDTHAVAKSFLLGAGTPVSEHLSFPVSGIHEDACLL